MTISNLGSLRDACNSWMARTLDTSLFKEFTDEVTNILLYGMRTPDDRAWIVPPLRSRTMHTTGTLSVSSAQATLPAAWLEFERVWINTNTGRDILYIPPQQFASDWRRDESGEPTAYTIDGSTMMFAPTSDATVQISYFQTLSALSADADTNVVLTAHPHVYRRGALWMARMWEGSREIAAEELAGMATAVKALNAEFKKAQRSGSLLVMRPRSVA